MPRKQSILLSIPVDQCQHVLSYMTSAELLTLSLVSKPIKAMAEHTHTLTIPTIDTSTDAKSTTRNHHLRRSIANIRNLDPISSVSYMNMNMNTNMRRSSLPILSSSSSSSSSKKEKQHITTALTDVMRLTNLLRKFRNLRTIRLHDASSMGGNFIPIINQCHAKSSLVHLEFHNVRMLKDDGDVNGLHLLKIPAPMPHAQEFHRLSHVELHGTLFCSYKVLKSFTMSDNLHTLKFSGCRALVDRDVEDIVTRRSSPPPPPPPSSCRHTSTHAHARTRTRPVTGKALKILSLENCSKLLSPRIQSQSLEVLSLAKNPLLRNLSGVHCPNLIELDLSFCSSLGNGAVEQLLFQTSSSSSSCASPCPYIQKLNLSGCRGFRKLCIRSDTMKDLNLGMCSMMQHATIVCPKLTSLNIGMCVELQALRLELDGMEDIDLSMLPIKHLYLYAPSARRLNLSGCCRLMADGAGGVEYMKCPNLMAVDICGTNLSADFFQVREKTKVKAGGEVYDWTDPFR